MGITGSKKVSSAPSARRLCESRVGKAADIATAHVLVDALSLLSGTILRSECPRSDPFEPEMTNADWTLDPIVSATAQAVIPNTIA